MVKNAGDVIRTIKLVDSTFSHENAIGLCGENSGKHPTYFRWDTVPGPARVKVFTDIRLQEAVHDGARKKIGIIVESPAVARESLATALELRDVFDIIFTNDSTLLQIGEPFKFYPFGGSWIKEWGMFPKTKLCSILTSAKCDTEGQWLRHNIIKRFGDSGLIDVYGEPYTEWLPSKVPALRPYAYSIIVENGRYNWHFSEKLIDCLSQGTIPIYWGCPEIGKFFDWVGILTFSNVEKYLKFLLPSLDMQSYTSLRHVAEKNLELARQYRCAEDWMWLNHQDAFNA